MGERGDNFGQGELQNNNQQDCVLADGDANANDIPAEDVRRTGDNSALSGLMTETTEQDKVIIWGTDSQCDDPELAEFEMLECQELEAYMVADGEDFVGLAERKKVHDQSSSCSKAAGEPATDNKSSDEGGAILQGSDRGDASESDAFVSCLSTLSSMATAMDTLGRTQTTDSWHMASGPYSTISEDLTLASQACNTISERGKASQRVEHPTLSSGKSTIHNVDVNLNSTVHSGDLISEAQASNGDAPLKTHACSDEHRKNNNQRNKAGRAASSERGLDGGRSLEPTAKQSHEESNTKMDKSTQADENPDVNSPKTGTKGTLSSMESKAVMKQRSFHTTLTKQNSFVTPSFENSFKKQHSFDSTSKKQGPFENTSRSSSLERRKPWGSPSRPGTPTSPKTASCSPKRQPPGSPARVQSIRAQSLERSSSPQRAFNQTVRPPGKTSSSSGIPKPIMPQLKEPDARRSSPPQKPKNIRPKIITYVRKNPQSKATDAPLEASTHPLRPSSYTGLPAHKDPKVGPQAKGTPVLCSSNLLFDKYRQEMQRSGYYPSGVTASGLKPPASAGCHTLGGKADSLHEEVMEKHPQEVRTHYSKLYIVVVKGV